MARWTTEGQPSQAVLRYAYLNAHFQTGLSNPLDEAIEGYAKEAGVDISGESKVDEIPYDFVRKRLSVVVHDHDEPGRQAHAHHQGRPGERAERAAPQRGGRGQW